MRASICWLLTFTTWSAMALARRRPPPRQARRLPGRARRHADLDHACALAVGGGDLLGKRDGVAWWVRCCTNGIEHGGAGRHLDVTLAQELVGLKCDIETLSCVLALVEVEHRGALVCGRPDHCCHERGGQPDEGHDGGYPPEVADSAGYGFQGGAGSHAVSSTSRRCRGRLDPSSPGSSGPSTGRHRARKSGRAPSSFQLRQFPVRTPAR